MTGPPWHHTPKGFRNPPGSPQREPIPRMDRLGFIWRQIIKGRKSPIIPDHHVLDPASVRHALARHDAGDSLTWLGHAAFLLTLNGKRVLFDPYLGDFASPVRGVGPKRFVPPALRPRDLPPIDLLIVSHNHYDHLCAETIEALPGKDRCQVAAPLGLGVFFRKRGYKKIAELDWHQVLEVPDLRVTALPAVHWSKRTPFDRNKTLWGSFLVESKDHKVWFAGDTGYGAVFKEIGHRYGPIDLALTPIGAYAPRPIMRAHHVTPEEAVQIGKDIEAHTLVAMHWGTVTLTEEHPFEPPARFRLAAEEAGFGPERAWVMQIGETRALANRWPRNSG